MCCACVRASVCLHVHMDVITIKIYDRVITTSYDTYHNIKVHDRIYTVLSVRMDSLYTSEL